MAVNCAVNLDHTGAITKIEIKLDQAATGSGRCVDIRLVTILDSLELENTAWHDVIPTIPIRREY